MKAFLYTQLIKYQAEYDIGYITDFITRVDPIQLLLTYLF